jgi:hypothetical protein
MEASSASTSTFSLSRSVRVARRRQQITSPFRERSFSFACYLSSR